MRPTANLVSWSDKGRFRIGLFSVYKINDVKGLLVQMHPKRKMLGL